MFALAYGLKEQDKHGEIRPRDAEILAGEGTDVACGVLFFCACVSDLLNQGIFDCNLFLVCY